MDMLEAIFLRLQTAWDFACECDSGDGPREFETIISDLAETLPEKRLGEPPSHLLARAILTASSATMGRSDRWHRDAPLTNAIIGFLDFWKTVVDGVRVESWRELPYQYLRHLQREYRDLLLSRTRILSAEGDEFWTAAHSESAAAALVVAEHLKVKYGSEHRLIYPWLALAGLGGPPASQMARILVGARLAQDEETRHLAASWLDPFTDLVAIGMRPPGWAGFVMEPRKLLEAEMKCGGPRPPRPMTESARPTYARPSGRYAKVVAQSIGTADSEDGKQLFRAWSCLTRPMALAKGIAPDLLASVLSVEFPWMAEAIEAVAGDLRMRRSAGMDWAHWRPLLLVGAPGSGKTRFARRLAEILGTGFGEVNAAGSTDNRSLQGTARGWSSASPSYVLHVIRQSQTANPVIFVDEIDKVSSGSSNGDIRATLLGMLEPLSAKAWPDECLLAPVDLSAVNWVLAANDTAGLRGALLTRLRVVHVPLPTTEHFPAVLHSMRRDIAADLDVSPDNLPNLPPQAESRLRAAFGRGYSLRRIRAAIEGAIKAGGGMGREGLLH